MIPLMKNAFLEEGATRAALIDFLQKNEQLSMGKQCESFENAFAYFQGRSYAILFNSGASANIALLQACLNLGKLKRGAHVGFSAITWATNVMPIMQLQMLPVPVDCSGETINIMSGLLKDRLSQTTLDALFITNALGFTGDLPEIKNICEENNILLLEDNCESLGSELPEGRAGNFGLASTFSFYVAHHMSTIEGGMVCTDDEDLMIMLKLVRANGWDRNLSGEQQLMLRDRYDIKNDFEAKYTFYDLGYNLRPTEITGVLGNVQLSLLPESIKKREANYAAFAQVIERNRDFTGISSGHMSLISNFALPVLCKDSGTRERYISKFKEKNIEIRPVIAGNIQNQPFYKKYVNSSYSLSEADFIQDCGFYCGNCPDYTAEEIETICSALTQ